MIRARSMNINYTCPERHLQVYEYMYGSTKLITSSFKACVTT